MQLVPLIALLALCLGVASAGMAANFTKPMRLVQYNATTNCMAVAGQNMLPTEEAYHIPGNNAEVCINTTTKFGCNGDMIYRYEGCAADCEDNSTALCDNSTSLGVSSTCITDGNQSWTISCNWPTYNGAANNLKLYAHQSGATTCNMTNSISAFEKNFECIASAGIVASCSGTMESNFGFWRCLQNCTNASLVDAANCLPIQRTYENMMSLPMYGSCTPMAGQTLSWKCGAAWGTAPAPNGTLQMTAFGTSGNCTGANSVTNQTTPLCFENIRIQCEGATASKTLKTYSCSNCATGAGCLAMNGTLIEARESNICNAYGTLSARFMCYATPAGTPPPPSPSPAPVPAPKMGNSTMMPPPPPVVPNTPKAAPTPTSASALVASAVLLVVALAL